MIRTGACPVLSSGHTHISSCVVVIVREAWPHNAGLPSSSGWSQAAWGSPGEASWGPLCFSSWIFSLMCIPMGTKPRLRGQEQHICSQLGHCLGLGNLQGLDCQDTCSPHLPDVTLSWVTASRASAELVDIWLGKGFGPSLGHRLL
jgi:hypothetical protein